MRITIAQGPFLPVPPLKGGAIEKMFYPLGQLWASQGHAVTHISCAHPQLPARECINSVTYIRVPSFAPTGRALADKIADFRYAQRVCAVLPKADILITHTFFLPLMTPRSAGAVYVHAARFPKQQLFLYAGAARIQFPSSAVLSAGIQQTPFLKHKMCVVPNALPSLPPAPPVRTFPVGPIKLLYTGRIHPEKGLALLMRAVANLPEDIQKRIVLTLVGPHQTEFGGAGEAYLAELKLIASLSRAAVIFTGPVFDSDALAAYYASADLFVYPSVAETGESFGVSPLESLSHGVPVVVSALECFGDFVRDGQNGFTFNHRGSDPVGALSETLLRALRRAGDWPLLSAAARATAQQYSLPAVGELFIKDFEKITKPR